MASKKEQTFEEKLTRLSSIVDKVENSTLPLQESIQLYEEGEAIVSDLQKTLADAENKIKALKANSLTGNENQKKDN